MLPMGYPRRIAGDQIPVQTRIMTIADQYDALRSKRPYKPAFDHAKTVGIISKKAPYPRVMRLL